MRPIVLVVFVAVNLLWAFGSALWVARADLAPLYREHDRMHERCASATEFASLQYYCNQAVRATEIGYWFTLFHTAFSTTRWCFGHHCSALLADVSLATKALMAVVLLNPRTIDWAVSWFQNRKARRFDRFMADSIEPQTTTMSKWRR